MALYHYQVHGNTLKKGVKHWFTVKNHFKHLKGSSDINKPLLNLRSPPPTNSSDLMFYAFSQAQCLRRWKSKSLELLVPFRNTTQSTLQKTRLHSPEERRTSGFSMVFLMMLSLNSYTATPGPRLCRLTHWVPLWTRMRTSNFAAASAGDGGASGIFQPNSSCSTNFTRSWVAKLCAYDSYTIYYVELSSGLRYLRLRNGD